MLVQKFTKANLHTFEGISWFSGFQDLLYAMAIYKLDVVATKCGNGDNIETINVFVVTISYFLIFSLNRYILEQYCASFVRYAHSSAAYPLVQTDLFHRIIFTLYSIGTFVMVMNTSLVEITSTKHQSSSYIGKFLVAEVEVLHDPIVYCLSKIRFQGSKIRIFSIHTALLESDEKLSTSFQNDQNDQKRLLKQKRSEVLYYDGQQLQERLSEMFLAVLGESLISLLEESYDPENAGAILVSFLVLLLLISIGMQFYETVGKSVTDEHAILSPFVRRHAFITMQMVVTFCLWVASCGMVGLYSHVLFILPGKNSHSKQSVAPTSYPTSHPSSALDDDRNSYNDYYYYFYYADLSTEKVYLPSVSLAEWQVAIGLCLTELCCMLLRLMHVYQQRMVLMYRTELENRNQGANHSRSQNAVLGTLVPHTHQALPAHCTKMEIIYFLAAITHLCIFFFFERISSAHTATFFAFTAHSLVNIIVCSVYLFRRFAVEEKEDEEHLSRISNLLSAVKYVSPMQHQMSMPKSKSALVHDVEEELRQAVAANDDNEDKEEDDIDGHD